MNRNQEVRREEPCAELESQFILRLPVEPAKILREAIRSGANNLKDRLSIRLETDMRHGEVRVDHWLMHAKLLDLPTIIESMKTIDGKSFYKTADICQIMICKEEDDQTTTDEESPTKKKKDPNKVDKKFLWPHGITPPLKNVRKRRFRKTLKKKYAEAPEIEKEVKRLLRVDNDAVHVKFEIINEDEEKAKHMKPEGGAVAGDASLEASNQHSLDVAEHDIFGEAVSDSEEEETNINIVEMEDENSRLSADDSMHTDTTSLQGAHSAEKQQSLVTHFTSDMFGGSHSSLDKDRDRDYDMDDRDRDPLDIGDQNVKQERMDDYAVNSLQEIYHGVTKQESDYYIFDMPSSSGDYSGEGSNTNSENLYAKRRARKEQLEAELPVIRMKYEKQQAEISRIENQALQQRFSEILDNLHAELYEKQREYDELCKLQE